jgi:hypothetical protein
MTVSTTQTPNWVTIKDSVTQYLLLENGNLIQLEDGSGDLVLQSSPSNPPWTAVSDSQGSSWSSINTAQTPNWN